MYSSTLLLLCLSTRQIRSYYSLSLGAVTIAGALKANMAAYAEPSVKRFVLTSSSSPAVDILDSLITVTNDTWNQEAIERAWADSPYEASRSWLVYKASKTQAEQAIWEFHENRSKRPDFVVNAGIL